MPSLFVFQGNDQGVRFELEGESLSLGRDGSNAIQLHDTEVSRRHAELRRQGATYLLTDLGSSNGTFVNGQLITSQGLASGDELQLGCTLLLFTGGGDGSQRELAGQIDIVTRHPTGDQSRIIHSISQAEGSRLLDLDLENSASPWLARARSNLQVMYRTALAVSHTLDIEQLLERILQLVFEWVEADRGCIMLVNPHTNQLEPKVRRNRQGVSRDDRLSISKTILDYVTEHNEGVLTSNAREDQRWDRTASILQLGICEAICVPMQGRYSMVGVAYIDTYTSPQRLLAREAAAKFNEEHLKLMVAIAHQAALAIEDTRHYSAMVQAERLAAVGQTIAGLSHHIKNILQGIRAASWLIKDGLSRHDEATIGKGWEFVERHQERISQLMLDMLTFSKDREPECVPADLNRVGVEVVELLAARAADLEVDLRWQGEAELPTLLFDPEGLQRALLNVVANALDACESAREAEPSRRGLVEVHLRWDPAAALVRILVTDNGVGIPVAERERIFSMFVSHKGSRGTGLGLAVSRKIMQEHGGRIEVESTPGEGSRFTLELPANTDTPQLTSPDAREHA